MRPHGAPSTTGKFSMSAHAILLFRLAATPSRGGHLSAAQLGCELPKVLEGKLLWAMGGRGGVFPLAGWPPNTDTPHPYPHLTTAASCSVHRVLSFCLYLLWRWLKTRPWLPAGPEAEVTSLSLERLWGWKSTASPQFISHRTYRATFGLALDTESHRMSELGEISEFYNFRLWFLESLMLRM